MVLLSALVVYACCGPADAADARTRRQRFGALYGVGSSTDAADAAVAALRAAYGCRNVLAELKVTRRLRCSDKIQALRDVLVGEQEVKRYEYVHVAGSGQRSDPINRILGRDEITLMQLRDSEMSPCWIRYRDTDKGNTSLWFAASGEGAYLVKLDPQARNARTGAELLLPAVTRRDDYGLTLVERDETAGTSQYRVCPREGDPSGLKDATLNVAPAGSRELIKSMHYERAMDGRVLRGRTTYGDLRPVEGGSNSGRHYPHRIVDVQQGTMLGESFTLHTEVEVERIWIDAPTPKVLEFLGRRAHRVKGLGVAVFWIQMEHGKAKSAPGD